MNYLPIFVYLRDRPCLVVGGGEVAVRKVQRLLKTGARVTVVAPELCTALRELYSEGAIHYIAALFEPQFLDDMALVIAATDDSEVNERVSALARQCNMPVNVVDRPSLCSFIMPSIIDRGPVQIAISTGGASPVLARLLRARLEAMIPAAYGRLASLMGAFRDKVKRRFAEGESRRRFWEQVLQGPIAEMLFAGQEQAALRALEHCLEDTAAVPAKHGEVYLVGGGPGDPDLLTFRALRLMQQADVVLYDRLVAPPILELVRRDAERIYVGKARDKHALPQQDINQLLVTLAREGKRVLRLKGGDPFMFGRGGEEIDTLAEEGIPFQVVPGITAAAGCAAYAGIPLTHRDYAQSCMFVTGHLKDGSIDLNWPALVQSQQTLAVYMGLHGLEVLCRELIRHGMPEEMPVALIERGTLQNQRVIIGKLKNMPMQLQGETIVPPSMLIIGEVVKLHEKLRWFRPVDA